MVNGEWLIYDEYIRKFHILLKRPYVISTEAPAPVFWQEDAGAKWRHEVAVAKSIE
jgi:hypothetical protein